MQRARQAVDVTGCSRRAAMCMSHYNRFHSFHCCDYGVEQVGGIDRRGIVCTRLVLLRGITAGKSRCHDLDPFADHYTG